MKTDWSHLDKYRMHNFELFDSPNGATYGSFEVPWRDSILRIIANSAAEELGAIGRWEHVSVHAYDPGEDMKRIPTWEEMCFVKNLFWNEDECVVQFHPAKKDYVDCHPCVLHLWRSTKHPFPMPPRECV